MTMVGKTLVGLTVTGLLVAGPAFASPDVDKELAEMREMVEGLKQKVEAQEEQLQHQGGLLEDAQKVVREQQKDDSAKSALSEYWEAVDVSMSMAASYAWNFRQPDLNTGGGFPGVGANQGTSGLFYPFHGDHNSFQVDQVMLDISKEATDESRSGFGFTILYGNTAAFLGQGGNLGAATVTIPSGTTIPGVGTTTGDVVLAAPQSRRSFGDSTSDYYIHQAYISYLAPLGIDVEFTAGKFATLIGAEVADTSQNFNITMGNIYNLFQPIDHVGILASTEVGPISLTGGVVNEGTLSISSPDINKEKGYIGQVGFNQGDFGSAVTVLYTADGLPIGNTALGNNSKKSGIVDGVLTYSGDGFEAWLNGDYTWIEGSRPSAWGIAVAGRVPLTEVFSAALRLEYARDKGDFFGLVGPRSSSIYGATGTLAYELAENLTLRTEVRYDRVVESAPPGTSNEFFTNTSAGDQDQVVGLAQVVYAF